MNYPAHSEGVGAARVEVAVVCESHTPLPGVEVAVGVFGDGTGSQGSAVLLDLAADTLRSRCAGVEIVVQMVSVWLISLFCLGFLKEGAS